MHEVAYEESSSLIYLRVKKPISRSLQVLISAIHLVVPVKVATVVLSNAVPKPQSTRGTGVPSIHQTNESRIWPG